MLSWLRKAASWVVHELTKERAFPFTKVTEPVTQLKEVVYPFDIGCNHTYQVTKQVWVRVARKKFELQNEVRCAICKNTAIHAIG